MTLAGLNSAKPKTTIYCGALIDTEISTDQNRPFFDHSVKRDCNFLSFLLNCGQLNGSRAADRFSSTSVGQRDVLKEFEARLCGTVSAPVRPGTLCVRDIKHKASMSCLIKQKGCNNYDKKNGFFADGPCANGWHLCCTGDGCVSG